MNPYNEENLVEKTAIKIFTEDLGYSFINAFKEKLADKFDITTSVPCLGRVDTSQVVLIDKLREAIVRLNPYLGRDAVNLAIENLTKSRSVMTPVEANKEIYHLIRNGINVSFSDENGDVSDERVKIIDFNNAENNDFLLVSQLWVTGELYNRRADLVGFVNGLPLIFIEFKGVNRSIKDAFNDNLTDYKSTIPQLFWYNTNIILSNGLESKIGTITSQFEHFNDWKKISNENEKGIVSLDTIIKGTCEKKRFLDLFENFVLFDKTFGEEIKILAKNHQLLGVNNVVEKLSEIKENNIKRGKLGVFWHTQGSGKSYSMIFFSQKVLRKFKGNYTFLIVTDRKELDTQIYKNFANVGATSESEQEVRAGTIEGLRKLLGQDHRLVFTLIHKFQTKDNEEKFPVLSERSDIIVMTDEAHRSQYDLMALNMRNALPNAAFIGFTGTPLIDGEEEQTRETFGDYVSKYTFSQSVEDKATVPLYYENRIPSLQLNTEELQEGMNKLLEETEIDEDQEKKLSREFQREYHLITREGRLNIIAEDVIKHFNGRGNTGKAIFVAIDRLTAIKMYNKMKAQPNCPEIAVVFSASQNEIEYFKSHGLDVEFHRRRMVMEDLETQFKDPKSPLRLVIVCNMWLTGFDVPCLQTLYLDKPMKNHTLMQTIARANRVYKDKTNGLIIDYIGVFRSLQKALSIYAIGGVDKPIRSKEDLIEKLEEAIDSAFEFCQDNNIDVDAIKNSKLEGRIQAIEEAVDRINISEEVRKGYLKLADQVVSCFGAILPDKIANQYFETVKMFRILAKTVRPKKDVDINGIAGKIEKILDDSIEVDGYKIKENSRIRDISKIDFEALKKHFEKEKKHTEAESLKNAVAAKLKDLIKLNSKRLDLAEKLQKLIDEYNSGAMSVEQFYSDLIAFAQCLNDEEKRGAKEDLSEEELAIFDMLYKEKLTETEKNKIKKVSKGILTKLKSNWLATKWREKQELRAGVQVTIRNEIKEELADIYQGESIKMIQDQLFQHVYENYYGENKSVYELARQ